MPILVRMGSELDTCAVPSTWKAVKPYGTHPGHGSRDIHAFGPNRFNCNLMSHWEQNADPRPDGLETRYLHHSKHAKGVECMWSPSGSQIPRCPTLSARIGFIVI